MGWLLVIVGAILALGGAAVALGIGVHVVGKYPDPDDAERNASRYVRPAGRAALASALGMALILIGGIVLLIGALANL